jgi:hypothetical protein
VVKWRRRKDPYVEWSPRYWDAGMWVAISAIVVLGLLDVFLIGWLYGWWVDLGWIG